MGWVEIIMKLKLFIKVLYQKSAMFTSGLLNIIH